MKINSKTLAVLAAVLVIGMAVFLLLDRTYHFTGGHGKVVDALIARNVAARGGAEAWRAASSLRLSGQMDLGQGMHVPYVIEQKRPGKMCLEFVFDDETAIQCVDGKTGWKLLPFRGRMTPEPMTESELRDIADTANLDGLLFDSAQRGHKVKLLEQVAVDGRDAFKLQVTLPGGAMRWVYIDVETALEVKLEAIRTVAGKERRVETLYSDWQATDGLLIARRQETLTEGDKESHFLTVTSVSVNPPLDDARFLMPAATVDGSQGQSNAP